MLLKIICNYTLIVKIETVFIGLFEREDDNRIKLLPLERFFQLSVVVMHIVFMVKGRFKWFLRFLDFFQLSRR
jgi:hypothetical protein